MQQECGKIDAIVLENTLAGEEAYDEVQDETNKNLGTIYLPNTCRKPSPAVEEHNEHKQLNGEL